MRNSRIGAALIAIAATAALAGCGTAEDLDTSSAQTNAKTETTESPVAAEPTETASPEAEAAGQLDLVVDNEYFWRDSDGDWNYFVSITNPNEEYVWIFSEFTVEFLDADGVILDNQTDYKNLLPGTTMAMAGRLYDSNDLQVDSLNIRAVADGTYMPGETFGAFEVSEPEYSNGDWSATVSGTVTSSFVEEQEYVEVVVVLRASNGNPIATDFTYIDRLPSGGTARYEANLYDVTIDPANIIEVYVMN